MKGWSLRAAVLVGIGVAAVGCATRGVQDERKVVITHAYAGIGGATEFDWRHHSPVEYLAYLRRVGRGTVVVNGDVSNWITAGDVRELAAYVESGEACAGTVSVYSSNRMEGSTVGREARFLIEGYRMNRYPPRVSSADPRVPSAEEVRRWGEEEGVMRGGVERAH